LDSYLEAILQGSWCDEQQSQPNSGKTNHLYLVALQDNLEQAQCVIAYASQHAENAHQRYVHRYNLRSGEESFIPWEKVLILREIPLRVRRYALGLAMKKS